MTFSHSAILALAVQCAPNVAPQTVAAIVTTESRGRPFAININGARQPPPSGSAAHAAATAQRFIAAGYSVDLGLGQINSRNMRKLGLTWETVFDPCTNIAALGRVLTGNYETALSGRAPQEALRVALSMYNTGSPSRGLRNGYVSKVVDNAGFPGTTALASPAAPAAVTTAVVSFVPDTAGNSEPDPPRRSAPAAWDLFARAAFDRETHVTSAAERRRSVWAD